MIGTNAQHSIHDLKKKNLTFQFTFSIACPRNKGKYIGGILLAFFGSTLESVGATMQKYAADTENRFAKASFCDFIIGMKREGKKCCKRYSQTVHRNGVELTRADYRVATLAAMFVTVAGGRAGTDKLY